MPGTFLTSSRKVNTIYVFVLRNIVTWYIKTKPKDLKKHRSIYDSDCTSSFYFFM